jgi:hypothetical protein
VDLKHLPAHAAKQLPLPDLCHTHDWSPIAAGPPQSVLAGVLAGVSFLAVTVILTVSQDEERQAAAGQALKLLFSAFFGLATASYLLADLGGEQACPRGGLEEALAGSLLGTFSLVMISAMTWLVAACRQDTRVLNFTRYPAYVASAFVLLLLATNSVGTINSELNYGSHAVVSWALYLATAAVATAAAVQGVRLERAAGETVPDAGHGSVGARRVSVFAGASLVLLAVFTIGSGVALAVPAREFYPVPAWPVYTTAWAGFALPSVILVLAIRALARPARESEATRDSCGTGWPS